MDTDNKPVVHIVADDVDTQRRLAALVQAAGWRALTYARLAEFSGSDLTGCVVVDVPAGDGARCGLRQVGRGESMPPVIVITAPADIETAVQVMKDGAFDCVERPFMEGLLGRISAALEYDADHRSVAEYDCDLKRRVESLTRREREVMGLIATGTINKVIAYKLGLSRRTVETHRANVMNKMQAPSIAHLINMCLALDGPRRRRMVRMPQLQ